MSNAALKAGKGLLRDFGEVDQLQVSRKGTANFVTKSDVRTEKLLQRELTAARPDFGFLLEEGGEVPGKDADNRWIIDPLDGTNNFIHAVPYFCISIGLEKRTGSHTEIVAGVIYDPVHNELFSAEKQKGAYLNGRRLYASKRDKWDETMLVTGNMRVLPKECANPAKLLSGIAEIGATLRSYGATALDLANLAAGRYDACWFYSGQPWDYAAGMLIAQEAGALVGDLSGKPISCHSKALLACAPQIAPTMHKLLSCQ
ncbi:MAG: inositol monophosphatase family protein [Rickettsiales bacterium]|nr:inositol monophosphatase family protein [Rickettsiales bacterium]